MEEIFLIIPGKPIAKKTHRTRAAVNWKCQTVQQFQWFPQRKEADSISILMRSQYKGPLIDRSVYVRFEFYMPIPQRWNKDQKHKARTGILHHMVKPDVSNLTKFYEDCMKGAILTDDSLIVWSPPIKLYDDNPRTEILIKPFDYEEYMRFQQTFPRSSLDDTREIA